MNKIKKAEIIGWVFLILFITTIIFLTVHYNLFKSSQRNLQNSMAAGFGYYSDPVEGPCLTTTGGCGGPGTQKITKKCIINPVTGKGCIDLEGKMTFDNLINTVPCKKQCIGSAFDFEEDIQTSSFVDNQNVSYRVIKGSGGNKVVNQFGIDFTDEFVGAFDPVVNGGNYEIKKCFNSNDYNVYSTNTYNCNNGESQKASNNCFFTCGVNDKGALRPRIVYDNDLKIKVPNYPKKNGRYVCLDKFGNNQIEIFNTGTIPSDFIYPNTCYEIFYEDDQNLLNETLVNNVNSKQNYFTILNQTLPEYNLIYDYNFYYPLQIGNQNTQVEIIKNLPYSVDNFPQFELGYVYLDFDKSYQFPSLYFGPDFIELDVLSSYNTTIDGNVIGFPVSTFGNQFQNVDYFYQNSQMVLNYTGTSPSAGDYIFYRINSTQINHQSDFSQIESVDESVNSISLTIPDLGVNAYLYGIKFAVMTDFFGFEINTIDGTNDGVSAGNRIREGKYFLTDLILPDIDFVSVQNNQLVNVVNLENYLSTSNSKIFYVYSQTRREFYYPVSLLNYTDSLAFTLSDDYPNAKFNLLKGGISQTIIPPSKFLNYPPFEDLLDYIQAETISASYPKFNNYIKQLKFVSSGVSSIVNTTNSHGIMNGDSYYTSSVQPTGNICTVVKRVGTVLEDIDDKTEIDNTSFVQKMKLYNEINLETSKNFTNNFGTSFEFIVNSSRAILQTVDYNIYRSPQICFNEFNLPLQQGTKILIQPGEKVEYYKKSLLNSSNHNCGYYGTTGDVKVSQNRVGLIPSIGISVLVPPSNNYSNFSNFLNNGYNLEDLFCFGESEKCREPYITKEFVEDNYYNPDEDLFKSFLNDELYISSIKNNNSSPAKALDWKSVGDYNEKLIVNQNESIQTILNQTNFIYTSTKEGIVGENPAKIGVYYLYNKDNSIYPVYQPQQQVVAQEAYTLDENFYQNNWFSPEGMEILRDQYVQSGSGGGRIYDYNLNILSQTPGTSLYTIGVSLQVLNNFGVSDYVNPDFNFFNGILIENGISVFTFNQNSGYNQILDDSSVIDNVLFNSNLNIGDLIFIGYSDYDGFFSNYSGPSIYNYSFEVCKVLDFDIGTSTVNLERNLLEYPKENLFIGKGVSMTAYLLDPNLDLNLNYKITSAIGNTVNFNFSAYFESTPDTSSILNNYQSRSPCSVRIIKNEVEIPNANLNNSQNFLYLLSSPENVKVSAYIDILTIFSNSDSTYTFYFNELRENNYKSNNYETIFNVGDVISFNFNDNIYEIPILATKKIYQNSLYDYYSQSSQGEALATNGTNPKTYYLVNYFDFNNTDLPSTNSELVETLNPEHKDTISVLTGNNQSNIDPNNYSSLYYQNVKNFLALSEYLTFQNLVGDQVNLDKAVAGFRKMTLKSTRLYNDLSNLSSYLTIENIVLNEKPYGPSYLTNLVSSNDLDFNGYGTIVSFTIGNNLLQNAKIDQNLILNNLSGFKFSITTEVSKFVFDKALRNFETYDSSTSYNLGDVVSLKTSKNLLYENSNSLVSRFNTTGNAEYDQPYYIVSSNLYQFPLYLKEDNQRTSLNYEGISLWYENGFVSNGTSEPSDKIFKEFTLEDLKSNGVWKQTSNSIYPTNSLTRYNSEENYLEARNIEFEENVWTSESENVGTSPLYNNGTSWSLFNQYGELYSKNNYFFNINEGSSISVANIELASKLDTENYPLSLIDYTSEDKYLVSPGVLGISEYRESLTDTFLDQSYYSSQRELLAQVLIFKNNDNEVISLGCAPSTDSNIKDYSFLRQFSTIGGENVNSQYIYTYRLPDKVYAGKPFCTGNTVFNQNVSNYEYANTVSFIPVPISIENQDYPSLIYSEGVSIYDFPINSVFNNLNIADVLIEGTDGVFRTSTIVYKRSYYEQIYNYEDYENGFLKNGTSFYNYQISGEEFDFINIIDNSNTIVYEDSQPFYINDNEKLSGGGLIKLISGTSTILNSYNLFPAVVYDNLTYTNNNIIVNDLEIGVSLLKLGPDMITDFVPTIFSDGSYDFYPSKEGSDPNFSAYLSFDDSAVVGFDKIYIDTFGLTDGEKIYFLPTNDKNYLKCRFYGFFGNQYLSSLQYQSEDLISSFSGNQTPAVFSPYKNQVLNPNKDDLKLITSNGSNVITKNYGDKQFSDIFNLGVSNGDLILRTNPFKYPIFGVSNNIVLPNMSKNYPIGAINSESVINLISEEFFVNNYIVLGGISDVLPVNGDFNAEIQFYRETNGGLNTSNNSSLDCSIFQNSSNTNYPAGEALETVVQIDKLLLIEEGTVPQKTTDSVPTLVYNTTTIINQNDVSNNNNPIYIGLSSGSEFSGSLINAGAKLGVSSDLLVKYYLNNLGVSGTTYRNLNVVNNFNTFSLRDIEIVITNNDIYETLPDKTIYLGTSGNNGAVQFSGGVSSLTFTNY